MNLKAIVTSFRLPHLRAMLQLAGDFTSYARLQFLQAGVESGLLRALRVPATQDELAHRLGVRRPELLVRLLELGVRVKELGRDGARYRIRGVRSQALVSEDGDPMAAMLAESLTYHASVYHELPARLRGAPLGNYLENTGDLIVRSSRVLEPFVANLVHEVVRPRGEVRMLEIGCGSGVYLRYAARRNPYVSGVALDMQQDVVLQARENLEEWGLGDRFDVLVADVRRPPEHLSGPFDLVTLYNNVYYFTERERSELFRRVRSWLIPGGTVALVSMVRGESLLALGLDIALQCTMGCTALPDVDELLSQLREAGFSGLRTKKLMLSDPLYSIVASY